MKYGYWLETCEEMINKWQRIVTIISLALVVSANLSWAADAVKIGTLLSDTKGYNMKLVQVEGTVIGLQTQHYIG